MQCEICGSEEFLVNYGDAYTVICPKCHGTASASELSNANLVKAQVRILSERETRSVGDSEAAEGNVFPITIGGVVGFFLGGVLGFALRPSVPFIGQLSFEQVISRGASLKGLDQLLFPIAQQSFAIMLTVAIIGAVVGAVSGFIFIRARRS